MQPVDTLTRALNEAARGEAKEACWCIFESNPDLTEGQKNKISEIITGWCGTTQSILQKRREDLKGKLLEILTEQSESKAWKYVIQYLNLRTLFCMNRVSKGLGGEVEDFFSKGISPKRFARYLGITFYDTKLSFADKIRRSPSPATHLIRSHESSFLVEKSMKNLQWVIQNKPKIEVGGEWVLLLVREGFNYTTAVKHMHKKYPEMRLEVGDYPRGAAQPFQKSYLALCSSNIFVGSRLKTAEQQDQLLAESKCRKFNDLEFVTLSFCARLDGSKIYRQYGTRLQKSEIFDIGMCNRKYSSEVGINKKEVIQIYFDTDEEAANVGVGGVKVLSCKQIQPNTPRHQTKSLSPRGGSSSNLEAKSLSPRRSSTPRPQAKSVSPRGSSAPNLETNSPSLRRSSSPNPKTKGLSPRKSSSPRIVLKHTTS
jgi:hypothetical protein